LFGTRVAEAILAMRSTDRINRPDIWMQAIRSDHQKTLVPRGAVHNMGPCFRIAFAGDDDRDIHHGIAKRSVLPPPDMSMAAKPVEARPRAAAIALVIDLEFVLARAERHRAAPVQRSVPELDGAVFSIDGFREAENPLRLTADVGMQGICRDRCDTSRG